MGQYFPKKLSAFDFFLPGRYTIAMDREIIEQLTRLSAEEKEILGGQKNIRKDDYTLSDSFIINEKRLLGGNKQIDLRLHTRFIDFPEHGHDYMEFMYVYSGCVTHLIGAEKISLRGGDILFLNRHIRHSVLRTEQSDIGFNFIVSNDFLKYIFHNVQNNPIMSEFLTRNFAPDGEGEYLYFRTEGNFPIRNLMDNLIYAVVKHTPDDSTILTQIVSLLFSYLAYYSDTLCNGLRVTSPETRLKQAVSAYIEERYTNATLAELSKKLGYSEEYLSRRIALLFGKTFQKLLIEKRLNVAERLLTETKLSVAEIIETIGYENQSHFHRLFKQAFGCTPFRYRQNKPKAEV